MPTFCFRSLRELLKEALRIVLARAACSCLALSPGTSQPCVDALADYLALELAEHAKHLEHGLACGRAGVESLLMQVQVYALGLQLAHERQQVWERPTKAIY